MKKVLIAAAAAGFSIAICAGSAWFYIYSRGLSETGSARVFAKVLGCVWPTSIIMMDADKLDVGTILLFLVSSLANAFVYGIVAFSIYFVLRKLVGTGGRIGWARWPTFPIVIHEGFPLSMISGLKIEGLARLALSHTRMRLPHPSRFSKGG